MEEMLSRQLSLAADAANDDAMDGRQVGSRGFLQDIECVRAEVARLSTIWTRVLSVQFFLCGSLLVNAITTILHQQGFSLLSRRDLALDHTVSGKIAMMNTIPMLWALTLSFSTVVRFNSYLAGIPDRVSLKSSFSLANRVYFADEYRRMGVWLTIPGLGGAQ